MNRAFSPLAAASLLALVAAGPAAAQPAAPPAPAAAQSEGARLAKLFYDSDEDNLRRNPVNAIFRGDLRYADRLGDFITDDYFAKEKEAAEADLAALARIDRSKLNETDRIAYDVFKWQTEDNLKNYAPDVLAIAKVLPINHFSGFHTFYPTFASGEGAAPFRTVADYDNNLKRHRDYVLFHDRAIGRFREGLAAGIVDTRLTIRNVIDQLDLQLAQKPEDSPFYRPVLHFPVGFREADKARLQAAYLASIRDDIYPVYTRLRNFLRDDYLPHARDGVGLASMKGGDRFYQRLIESTTTVSMTPAQVHALGLSEVANPLGDGDDQDQGRFHRHPRPILRLSSHRPEIRADVADRLSRSILRDRPPGRRPHP